MTKQKIQKMIAVLCIAAAAVCLVLGLVNVPKQERGSPARKSCSSSASDTFKRDR